MLGQRKRSELTSGTEHLVRVVQELSAARELSMIMKIVRRAARDLTGADGASFVLRDRGLCFYADEDAITPLWKGRRFPMNRCVSGWSMIHRKPAVIDDVTADPRVPSEVYAPTFVKSLVIVPIRTNDPIGAIGAYWARARHATETDVALLAALADSTSIAMENVALYNDLTRALHEASIAKDSVERASHLKNSFLSMISHELRTPIASLSLKLDDLFEQVGGEPAALIESIRASADRLNAVIETLIEHARVEAGRLSLELACIDPAEQAAQVVDSLRSRARAKDLDLELEADAALPTFVTDARLLRVALCHLVENAIKFTPQGTVRVRVTRDGDRVLFAVSDSGPGIAGPDQVRIFEPFEQVEPIRRKHHAGVGLGLALVRSITTALGGRIGLSSVPGMGSTFTLSLPARA
jgi:signal transduction histidine kinase